MPTKWINVIKECIAAYPDRAHVGVSRAKIKTYIEKEYGLYIGPTRRTQLSNAIRSGERRGIFILPNGPRGKVKLTPNSKSRSTTSKKVSPLIRDNFDLTQAKGFASLLDDIQSHLLQSQSTRAIYVAMAKEFYSASEMDVKDLCSEPTDDDFLSYVQSHWPQFQSFGGLKGTNTLIWGWIQKNETQKTNEINILSDIVKSAELSTIAESLDVHGHLSADLYRLLLTTIILHEFAHGFTKHFFHDNVTPIGVSKGGDPQCGESGWLVEEQLMGGRLCVEWCNKRDFGDMERIDRVLLLNGSHHCWEVSADVAKTSLGSLQLSVFSQPDKEIMTKRNPQPAHSSIRARITEPTKNPVLPPVKPLIGLGIYVSFVGEDRIEKHSC